MSTKWFLIVAVVISMLTFANANAALVSQYQFEGNANDNIGGFNGTMVDGASIVADPVRGNVLSVSGNGGRVMLPALALDPIDASEQVTVALWVYGNDAAQNDTLFNASYANFSVSMLNVHLPFAGVVYFDAGNPFNRISKTGDPSTYTGGWNHWAFTMNSVTGLMQIYVNGNLWTSEVTPSNADGFGNIKGCGFSLGARGDGALGFNGMIDDFRIYDNVLNASEIAATMIPEPITLTLFGLGSIALIRKKK